MSFAQLVQFCQAHTAQAAVIFAALATMLGTVRNALVMLGAIDASNASALGKFADRLSWVAEHLKGGLFGLPLSLPGMATSPKGDASVAPVALLVAGALALGASGCAMTGLSANASVGDKLKADSVLVQKVVSDVKDKCGPQFVSLAPVFAATLQLSNSPADVTADLLSIMNAYPALVSDLKAALCVWQTVIEDFRAAGLKAQADVGESGLAALESRLGVPPGARLACAR